MLLDRAHRGDEDGLAASVIAELLYGMRDCKTVLWSDIAKHRFYPVVVRAAAHFGAGAENTDEGRATITECARISKRALCWHSFSKALLSTTWWRERLSDILNEFEISESSFRPELEKYLDVDPKESVAQEFISELRKLLRRGKMPRETQFAALLILVSAEDSEAAQLSTALLPDAGDVDIDGWLNKLPFMDDDLQATGIRNICARPMLQSVEFARLRRTNFQVMLKPAGRQRSLDGRGPFHTTFDHSAARRAAAAWTFVALDRLMLSSAQRAQLIVGTVRNDYGTDWRQLLTMLRDYLSRVEVIDGDEWDWIVEAIDALADRGHPIDIDILWAVFDKSIDLPTWHVLELIWSVQGETCCDRLKVAFAERPEKRGEILGLLEEVAPRRGFSVRVIGTDLHVEG
jgi:predicted nucleic acid-binding protein